MHLYLGACTADQWRCDNGECIRSAYRCDPLRAYHCTDRSDEVNCMYH